MGLDYLGIYNGSYSNMNQAYKLSLMPPLATNHWPQYKEDASVSLQRHDSIVHLSLQITTLAVAAI